MFVCLLCAWQNHTESSDAHFRALQNTHLLQRAGNFGVGQTAVEQLFDQNSVWFQHRHVALPTALPELPHAESFPGVT